MTINELFERRRDFFINANPMVRGGVVTGFVLGVIALVIASTSLTPGRIWGALLMNGFFFFSLALGGVVFAGIQDLVGAVWCRPVKRIHEAFGAFLPIVAALLGFFLLCILFDVLGARSVYIWMVQPEMLDHFPGKNQWLQPKFMAIRDLVALFVIVFFAMWQIKLTVRRDIAFANGDQSRAQEHAKVAAEKIRFWIAPILLIYALAYSLLGFDMIMSLSPLWFSTLWGGWLFAIMMQTLMATLLTFMFALKSTSVGSLIERQQFHDVGKLMHGFTIFFAYLTYAHVLTYWYGNVPEETEYFLQRLQGPWFWIVVISPFFSFVIPLYTLIFKAAKWTAAVAIPLALMILVAQWFVYVLVLMPEVTGEHWQAPWVDLGVLVAMLSAFVASFLMFAKRVPMVGIADPLLFAESH